MNWKNIVNLETLKLTSGKKKVKHYGYTTNRPCEKMGAKKLGFNVSTIPPKQFSCPYHLHHSEEELFLVLEGKAMLRQCDKFREVVKGDLIFFTTGPEGVHQFYNHTNKDCKVLAISNMEDSEVCEYPDSKKTYVSRLKKVFQLGTSVDYFTGETDPRKFWPKKHL